MSYNYHGKNHDIREPRYIPFSREEMAAKIAYYRDAESRINGGPAAIYTPPAPLKPMRPRLDIPDCGTNSGYARHMRLGQEPCRSCLDARGNYQREYRARKRVTGIAA